jgi:hypothetical protein
VALRRGREPERPASEGPRLDAPEHSWWAAEPAAPKDEPDADEDDPYVVLKVDHNASWDDIVLSYRRLARWWHPDGLVNPAPGERELCEDMIRRLNIAYTQLRVRRGR